MPPTLGTISPRLVLRPLVPGTVINGGPSRAIVTDPTLGLDTFAASAGDGPLTVSAVDFVAATVAENFGATCAGPIAGLIFTGCSFQNWNTGLAAETGVAGFSVVQCYFENSGTVAAIFGNASHGLIVQSVFNRSGWNPQGQRQEPTQLQALYVNPENCSDITIDGCLFNDSRMNAARCCGTVCKKSVFINNGCATVGAHITRTIAANVVTLAHDPGLWLVGGMLGLHADSPNGIVYSGNVVAHAGSEPAASYPYGMGVHGSYSNVAMQNNIVFDWAVPDGIGGRRGCGIGWGAGAGANNLCTGNQIQMPNGGKCIEVSGDSLPNIKFGGNIYYSIDPRPFVVNGQDMTFEEWVALTGDTTSRFVQIDYADPGRSAERYVREELGVPVTDPGAQIAVACRAYPGLIQQFARYMRDGLRAEGE